MTPKSRYFLSLSKFILLLLTILFPSTVPAASSPKTSYDNYCGSVVPQYLSIGTFHSPSKFLQFSYGHYSGGEKLFAAEPGSSLDSTGHPNVGSSNFQANYIQKTKSPEILKLGGSLSFQGPQIIVKSRRRGRHQSEAFSSTVHTQKYVHFELSGFWSESTGMICMVGTGSSHTYEGKTFHLSAVFKLYYPKISNISTSIVNGTVESLDPVDSLDHFEKITVLAYAQKNYSYMDFPPSVRDSCSNLKVPKETRRFEMDSVGSYIPDLVAGGFKLERESGCSGGNCYPFSLKIGSTPSFLSLSQIYFSEEGKFHTRIGFSNSTPDWFNIPLEPEDSLVGEGFWDHDKNQMCLVACQVLANASVGDCTIGLSLWFPLVLTIKSRSQVMGRLWSNKNMNDPGYFSTMPFRDLDRYRYRNLIPSMEYKYSVLDGASECDAIKNTGEMGPRTYPDGSLKQDLIFSLLVTRGERSASGSAYPLSIGDTVFADSFVETKEDVNVTVWNVSYEISYWFFSDSSSPREDNTQISAEGLYNSRNGHLCMVGCMHGRSSVVEKKQKLEILWIAISLSISSFLPWIQRKGSI